jgi:cell volume regulation protein A
LRGVSLGRYSFTVPEQVLLSWAGLKGAVPIILAIVPLSLGVPGADYIFNVIFVVVIVGTILQGFTLSPLAQRLGLAVAEPPRSPLRLELGGDAPIGSSVLDVYLEPGSRAVGVNIMSLGLPDDIVIAAVLRRGQLVTPRGSTVFEPGDHVYLISSQGDTMGTPTQFLPRKVEADEQPAEATEDG